MVVRKTKYGQVQIWDKQTRNTIYLSSNNIGSKVRINFTELNNISRIEVESTYIGELVMRKLKAIDKLLVKILEILLTMKNLLKMVPILVL